MRRTVLKKENRKGRQAARICCLLTAAAMLSAVPCPAAAGVSGTEAVGTAAFGPGVSGPGETASAGGTVSAESGITRSAGEWAQLRDDRLEWQEITGLVEEYSPAVMEERRTYRKNENRLKDASQTSKALMSAASEYEDLAASYDGVTGGQLQAAEYRLQAEKLREQAADNTGDGRILALGMEQAVVKEKKNVRDRFVSWYEAKSALEENTAQISGLEKEVRYAKIRKDAGLSAPSSVTSAERSLASAKGRTVFLETAGRSAYRDLIVSCGWKYDANAEIGGLPGAAELPLTETENAQGEAVALERSFLLREDRIRLENAVRLYGEGAVSEKAASRLAADTEDVRDAYTETKEALKIAGSRYAEAGADVQTKEQDLSVAKKQLESGSVSEQEYQKKQTALETAKQSQRDALYSLIRARSAYDAVLEGLSL